MENNLNKLADFLKDSIAEMYEYANSDEYDDMEQHDCCIAAEAYEHVLSYVEKLIQEEE